jgi:demethylphylloquinone reductase
MSTPVPARICILGGGFGGLYTALRLSQLPWPTGHAPQITLVDQRDRFVFAPLLYELMTGELADWEVAPNFVELLTGTGVQFIQAAVERIDLAQQQVVLAGDRPLAYDQLVLALGGETPRQQVPGAADYAMPFRTLADAYRLEAQLKQLEDSDRPVIRVAVVGGGYSGVELVCKLADRLKGRGRLRLVELGEQILAPAQDFNRKAALKALQQRGVWIDLQTQVESVTADQITLRSKSRPDEVSDLPVDVVLWTVGNRVAEAIAPLDLPKNTLGQLRVTPTLQVEGHANLYALGDLAACADAKGKALPATAQVAFQQAQYAGWNIWASLTQRPSLPFRYQHLGEMMALGQDNASLSGLGLQLDGPLAYVLRRVAYLNRLPTFSHQMRVATHWLTRPVLGIFTQS